MATSVAKAMEVKSHRASWRRRVNSVSNRSQLCTTGGADQPVQILNQVAEHGLNVIGGIHVHMAIRRDNGGRIIQNVTLILGVCNWLYNQAIVRITARPLAIDRSAPSAIAVLNTPVIPVVSGGRFPRKTSINSSIIAESPPPCPPGRMRG